MSVSITKKAAEKVAYFISNRGKGEGIRLAVRTTGCSGFAYNLEFVDTPNPEDLLYENNGVKLFVDPKSLVYINGIEVDYGKEGLNEGFKFINPNEKDRCGCGESFRV